MLNQRYLKQTLILLLSLMSIFAWSQTYNMVYDDEFNGDTLDLTKWNIQVGYAPNQEKEYYTNGNNIRVENGNLIISAKKENVVTDRNYSSGRIYSKSKGFLKYGKVEARISVPSGAGTWPAFWMMPQSSVYGSWPKSGEIDILEHIGSDPRMTSHAVHTALKNGSLGNNWFTKVYKDSMENNFHIYSINWDPDQILFYIDNIKTATLYRNYTDTYTGWPFDQEFYVILNLAVGGTMGGTIDDNIFNNPVELKVDYVRLYQLVTAIDEVHDSNVKVFPTKFSDKINIDADAPTRIKIFDNLGKILVDRKISGNVIINTSNFSNGIYFLQTNTKTFKLIK
ncbi:MAG: family 16 glycosylhydrolase [Paludibacter sp.]